MTDRIDILLVDDQPSKLLSYEAILNDLGENLITAGSAKEALEHLLRRNVAVVLVDVCMPDLDGFELASMIREHPRYQNTAIIFVSAIALTDLDRLRGYEAGAVDYVPVPVVPEVLRAKVKIFAELHRKTQELKRLNAELERRVDERTAELAQANVDLERRVEERTREREAALAQVHEMQKLESLGQLTGGLAHDFNNLLMAILANLDLLMKRVGGEPAARRLVDGAIRAAERGANLTGRMLAFARRQELKPETVDVPRLVRGMTEMLRRSLGPSIEIAAAFDEELAPTRVDPNQLELALLNLALNARDAMPIGGRLEFRASCDSVGPDNPYSLPPGDFVRIAVSDTGGGMDEVTVKRATEPFFTTKGVGKGTGLGLSMVHGLAAQSGGAMRIRSRVGDGTTVELWLPVADIASDERGAATRPLPLGTMPSYRILLVDDDPMILAGTGAMLEDLGHSVIEATCGSAALGLLEDHGAIDLVITDHAMPGMTGLELASAIRGQRRDMPIIIATGYADLVGGADPTLPRLTKPYRQAELAAMIATAVGAHAPSAGAAPTPLRAYR
jgi:signal transduction histidine kinase